MAFMAPPPAAPLPSMDPDRRCSTAAEWGLTKEDKWKVASHLHKAIRHGRPDDAEQGARWLYDIEPAYLRYRMAVIAVEDVAAGSPEVVAESFSGGWTKSDLHARGERDFLVAQARAWAGALKDRTPCAWLSCQLFLPQFVERFGPWEMMSLGQGRRLAFDLEQPWWVRGLGAWRAVGSDKLRASYLPTMPGDFDAFAYEAQQLGLSEAWMTCIRIGGKAQGEPHPIFLPLAAHAQQHEEVVEATKTIPQLGYAGPWLSAALDKHTSEGKRALGSLLQAQRPGVTLLREAGADRSTIEHLVGRLWFWMEGGLLDRVKTYPTSQLIDKHTKHVEMQRAGLSGQLLYEAFGKNLPAWHQARRAHVHATYSPAAPLAESTPPAGPRLG